MLSFFETGLSRKWTSLIIHIEPDPQSRGDSELYSREEEVERGKFHDELKAFRGNQIR